MSKEKEKEKKTRSGGPGHQEEETRLGEAGHQEGHQEKGHWKEKAGRSGGLEAPRYEAARDRRRSGDAGWLLRRGG